MGDRGEPDRDVVEDLGEDAAEPDEDRRAEQRVAGHPDDQLEPGSAPSARRATPRTSSAAVAAELEELRGGRAADAPGSTSPSRTPPTSLLWARPAASSLGRPAAGAERPAIAAAAPASAAARRLDDGDPGGPEQGEAVDLGQGPRRAAPDRRRRPRPAAGPSSS